MAKKKQREAELEKPEGDRQITFSDLEVLIEQYGRKSVEAALRSFQNESGLNVYTKDPTRSFEGIPEGWSFTNKEFFGTKNAPTLDQVRETTALLEGKENGPGGKTKGKEARALALAALKPRIGIKQADAAQQRSTQQQRAAQFGASQTNATTPSGLFDPAHLARRKLTDNAFFRPAGQP